MAVNLVRLASVQRGCRPCSSLLGSAQSMKNRGTQQDGRLAPWLEEGPSVLACDATLGVQSGWRGGRQCLEECGCHERGCAGLGHRAITSPPLSLSLSELGEAVGSCRRTPLVGSKAKAGAGPGNKLGAGDVTPLWAVASASGFSTLTFGLAHLSGKHFTLIESSCQCRETKVAATGDRGPLIGTGGDSGRGSQQRPLGTGDPSPLG